jgi:hypothetical protein
MNSPLKKSEGGSRRRLRKGTILVVAAIVMIALLGLLGLVIDAGQLMTAHRAAQNAADAGATAAAMDMLAGKSNSTASGTASTFVQQYNGLPSAIVTANIPPASGPHAGDAKFVEVIVSNSVQVRFIQILGVGSWQTVKARAVAGQIGSTGGGDVMLLDPRARPGYQADGSAYLKVNGSVIINSNGGGQTAAGQPINNGNTGSAMALTGNAKLIALSIQSVGGITTTGSAGVQNYNGSNQSPLTTGVATAADPLQNLPPPTTSNGAVGTTFPAVNMNGVQTATLSPGVYPSISLTASASATFQPGIYIITGGGLNLSGNAQINGSGVMIYNTGSDYNVNTGLPDSGDAGQTPPASSGTTFGGLNLSGSGNINFTPLSNSSSVFNGMGFYQRRFNTQPLTLTGNTSIAPFKGTIYSKWSQVVLQGSSHYASQFIVGSVAINGGTAIVVDATGQPVAKVSQVFLVE